MIEESQTPKTLVEAIRYFSDPDVCLEFVANLRWPDGVTCPHCECKSVYFLKTRRVWKCKECHKQFSVKAGTIFEDSALGLDKWLIAIWMLTNAKNGDSSWELHRNIGVTQKTAWHMLQRIRLAMQTESFSKLKGEVEVDESFIGGKARNMHVGNREEKIKGRGAMGKVVVLGLLERHGEVRTCVTPDTKRRTLQPHVKAHVEPGSELFSDALKSYDGLDSEYAHHVIDHAEAYVQGKVHTNGLENFWSLFKRCIKGTYVSVEPFHLFRYLDEEEFRFNNRKETDAERFRIAGQGIVGKRLTYQELIGTLSPCHSSGRAVVSM